MKTIPGHSYIPVPPTLLQIILCPICHLGMINNVKAWQHQKLYDVSLTNIIFQCIIYVNFIEAHFCDKICISMTNARFTYRMEIKDIFRSLAEFTPGSTHCSPFSIGIASIVLCHNYIFSNSLNNLGVCKQLTLQLM